MNEYFTLIVRSESPALNKVNLVSLFWRGLVWLHSNISEV